jgi:uncharacterized small protein (DUF1192 family)
VAEGKILLPPTRLALILSGHGIAVELEALSSSALKALVIALLGKVAALEQTVAAQREEIARLKGLIPGCQRFDLWQPGIARGAGGAAARERSPSYRPAEGETFGRPV